MFSYVILTHDGYSGFQLAVVAYGWIRSLDCLSPGQAAMPLGADERTGAEVLILEAKGVDLGERATDLRRAVRTAVSMIPARLKEATCPHGQIRFPSPRLHGRRAG